jgi:hypothetical protein
MDRHRFILFCVLGGLLAILIHNLPDAIQATAIYWGLS